MSGNESRAFCTFLLEGPSIRQQRFMLIRRNTREEPALWRAHLFSGRLSFSVPEQKSADEGGSRVGADADGIVCAPWREGGGRALLHHGICYHFSIWQHIEKQTISNNSLKSKELKQSLHSTTNALL